MSKRKSRGELVYKADRNSIGTLFGVVYIKANGKGYEHVFRKSSKIRIYAKANGKGFTVESDKVIVNMKTSEFQG